MRKIANLLLILFLVAAGLGIVSELLNPFWPQSSVADLRRLATPLVLLTALPVSCGLALNRRLPQRIFVPLLLWSGWGLLDFWPLESVTGSHYRLYAACGQLLLGGLLVTAIRRQNGTSLLLSESRFAGPGFCATHFLRCCLIGLPLLPLLLLLFGYAAANRLITENTAGFVRLKPNGLYLVEKVYTRGEKTIRLAGMIHLGAADYYAELSDSFMAGSTLLLAEGVTDAEGLLQARFSYGNIAELLGLASQEQLRFPGRLIGAQQLEQPGSGEPGRPDVLRADIDLREFDPRTLAVLNAIGTYLLNSRSLTEGYRAFSRWAEQHLTPETNRILMDDLLQKRNRALLSYLPPGAEKIPDAADPLGRIAHAGARSGGQGARLRVAGIPPAAEYRFFRPAVSPLVGESQWGGR